MAETYYYIHLNGQQHGPFPQNLLIINGMTPQTLVWREGMATWAKAETLPELQHLFLQRNEETRQYDRQRSTRRQPMDEEQYQNQESGRRTPPQDDQTQWTNTQQPYGNGFGQGGNPNQYGYGPGQGGYPQRGYYPEGWSNCKNMAIIGIVLGLFSCLGLIFGIVALTKANEANKLLNMGNYPAAQQANNSARTWAIVSLIVDGLAILIFLFGSM